jgi:hypothetical protein
MGLSDRTLEILAGGEGLDVEYKTSVAQEFNEILVAFANAEGGICLFGVEDATAPDGRHIGRVVGIEISDRTRGKIQSRADTTLDPVEIEIAEEQTDDGLGIYVVTVKEGERKPYCTGGGRYLVRRDGQNAPITPGMMERFIAPRLRQGTQARQVFLMDELRDVREELASAMSPVRLGRVPFYEATQSGLVRRTDIDNLAANCTDPELANLLTDFIGVAARFAEEWFAAGKRLPSRPGDYPPVDAVVAEFLAGGGRELQARLEELFRAARRRMDVLLGH